ncbi:MAG: MBOAT family O-acyltransferase [Solirubrobacterales bacterium]
MLFNSYEFIFVFLPITLIVYFTLARFRLTKSASASLVLASLAFYSYWDIRYLPLLSGSIIFNYTVGSLLEKTPRKPLLAFGVAANLSLLGYFKYTGFFLQSFNALFGTSALVPEIVLPLGISFFTFTQTAYLVDTYRGETKHYSFLNYSLFVTIFPHLIAGPIIYHKSMIPQFTRLKNFVFSHQNMAIGISLFTIGLFKKVVIADSLAPWATTVFSHAGQVNLVEAWAGALAYTLQLYFDFSGYSEMAQGLGFMFNFVLPVNFNSPYQATSIIDFWRRWHMTLSAFLKNYLYIPLGGNRDGYAKRMRNLFITMLLGGLWHGAGWTYVIWGSLHGLYLIINHGWRRMGYTLPVLLAWPVTFVSVVLAWVFFRATNLSDAVSMLQAMVGLKGVPFGVSLGQLTFVTGGITELAILFALVVLVATMRNANQYIESFKPGWKWAIAISCAFSLAVISLTKVSEFLYFQF